MSVAGDLSSLVASPTFVPLNSGGSATPLDTSGPTGYSPAQIRHAYGFDQITFNNGTVVGDGTGTTIAIVDAYNDPNIASDLHQFDLAYGLPDPVFNKYNQTGGTKYPSANSGWITEIALDVEWAHAIAPKATIDLFEANSANFTDLFTAVQTAAKATGVDVISMSWGTGEFTGENTYDSYFVTPTGHNGVTFLASSGDSGAPAIFPSISKNVVSVGGTSLPNLDSAGDYSSESGWSGSGGGLSAGTTAQGFESQPSYQNGVVTQSSTERASPDVAYDADPNTGFSIYESYNNGTILPWTQLGGTSDAAPQWAALIAIADQGRALAGLGSLDGATQTLPKLYSLWAGDFHDITSGSSTGTPSFSAGPGYDLVTGRGTPVANLVVADLVSQPQGPAARVVDGTNIVANGTGSFNMGSTFVGTALTTTFTIQDIGTQSLTLSGPITLPTGFSLVSGFGSTTVAPGGTTSFTVRLDGTSPGSYSGQVSFGTNDPKNNPYTFTLSGTVGSVEIIDDSTPGYTNKGSWTQWTNGGYLGDVEEATAKTGADVSYWTFGNLLQGQYRVSVTWTAWPDRATNAPYTVLDGSTSQGMVAINQQASPVGFTDQGATWQDLGDFESRNGSFVVQLSDAANGNVIADAVRLEYLGPIPPGPVVQVADGTTNVPDGTGSVSLGNTTVGVTLAKTITVKDLGNQAVTLTGPIVLPAGFSLVSGFGSTTVAPGSSTSFTVQLNAAAPGTYSGTVSFGSNDPNNNPYTFTLSGSVGAVTIIDDSNPGYTKVGSWSTWTGGGYLGDVQEATGKTGADVASWTFSNLSPAQYRVSVTWTAWSDRATNAPYTVLDGSSALGTVALNQQVAPVSFSDAGANWQDLGNFEVRNGSLVVQLSDAGVNGSVIADAVRVQWVAPLPPGASAQVLDGTTNVPDNTGAVNLGSTFVGAALTKTFTIKNLGSQALMLSGPIVMPAGFSLASSFASTTVAPGATTTFTIRLDAASPGSYSGQVSFGTDDPNNNPFTFTVSGTVGAVNIIDDSNPGWSKVGSWTLWTGGGYLGDVEEATGKTGADVASWTFSNVLPGQYDVSVTWTAWSDRATNAPYTVLDGSTALGTVVVNQQTAPASFSDAGAMWQDLGNFQIRNGSVVVQLSDAANGSVIADAVRLQWLGPIPAGPVAQVLDGTTNIPDGTGSVTLNNTFVGTAVTKTFTVKDYGSQPVTLSGPIVLPTGFSLVSSFGSTTLAPGASTTFTVQLNATTPNTYSGQVSFGTNDPNNNPFTFTISGTVASVKIIDDSDPGYSTKGSWTQWTNGGFKGDVEEATAKTGADVSTWKFTNILPGQYEVAVTWTAWPDRATNAPYTVLDGSTVLTTASINQQVAPASFNDAGAAWQDLGTFELSNGTLSVQLSDAANGNVIADAVRLVWLGPPPAGPHVRDIGQTPPIRASAPWLLPGTREGDACIQGDRRSWLVDLDGTHTHSSPGIVEIHTGNLASPFIPNVRSEAVDKYFAQLGDSAQRTDTWQDGGDPELGLMDESPWAALGAIGQ
jgi:hypothetical protein